MKKIQTTIRILNECQPRDSFVECEIPRECPKCHAPFVHSYSQGILSDKNKVEILLYCNHCYSSFIATYSDAILNENYNPYDGYIEFYAENI